ncbi:MAG: S-methyl-5-thioribose-1-phosphate isomerase, partial [Burkholderiales bacterium]|nr:S-methyl-5-thioribose-1-phosphate isomerase [Burkholderiales bacterium]
MKVGDRHYRSLWADRPRGPVHIIDQTKLPHAFESRTLDSPEAVAEAIQSMRVRGAPLIGVSAAFGVALAMSRDSSNDNLRESTRRLAATRPTAVNLAWALARMHEALDDLSPADRASAAWFEAQAIADEDAAL